MPGRTRETVSRWWGAFRPFVAALGGACLPLLPGYRVRIADGSHLAATRKRLRVTEAEILTILPEGGAARAAA